jgi:hypothetical protein
MARIKPLPIVCKPSRQIHDGFWIHPLGVLTEYNILQRRMNWTCGRVNVTLPAPLSRMNIYYDDAMAVESSARNGGFRLPKVSPGLTCSLEVISTEPVEMIAIATNMAELGAP